MTRRRSTTSRQRGRTRGSATRTFETSSTSTRPSSTRIRGPNPAVVRVAKSNPRSITSSTDTSATGDELHEGSPETPRSLKDPTDEAELQPHERASDCCGCSLRTTRSSRATSAPRWGSTAYFYFSDGYRPDYGREIEAIVVLLGVWEDLVAVDAATEHLADITNRIDVSAILGASGADSGGDRESSE